MVKCKICGKRFETVAGLREHYRAIHPNRLFVAPKARFSKRILVIFIIFLVATGSIVGYLIYSQAQAKTPTHSGLLGSQIPASLYEEITNVSDSTLSSIGYQQSGVTAPSQIPAGTERLYENKPEVLYIGAEWCPYCAAERWALVVALSKFGNFTGLEYMMSSSSDTPSNIASFTFVNATYSSSYISFVSVEHEDRNDNPLQQVTPDEQDLWDSYTSDQDTVPFVYIDAQYYLTGAQYLPVSLSGLNWTQIGSQLNDPKSSVAELVDGAANQLIGAICLALQSRSWPEPKSLCSQSFANVSYSNSMPNYNAINYAANPQQLTWTSNCVEIGFVHLMEQLYYLNPS